MELVKNLEIQEEYNCQGYFGFGNGIAINRIIIEKGHKSNKPINLRNAGCSVCLIAQACLESHKVRVRKMVPELTKFVDDLAKKGFKGPGLFKEIERLYKEDGSDYKTFQEPYLSVMAGNFEDAAHVFVFGKPKDRGKKGTLPYPFKTN